VRVFLDTNVLASALSGHGLCRDLFDRLIVDHELLFGVPVRKELDRILVEKFRVPEPLRGELFNKLDQLKQVPSSKTQLPEIPDPDDVPILACAIAGRAELFVTGDKELLQLRVTQGMPIVSPRQAWLKLFPGA